MAQGEHCPSLRHRCFPSAPAFPSLQDFGSGRVARGQSRPRSARNAAVSSTRSPLRRDYLTAAPFAGRSCARSVPRGERSSVSVAAEHHRPPSFARAATVGIRDDAARRRTQASSDDVLRKRALTYLRELKERLKNKKDTYDEFLEIMKEFKAQRCGRRRERRMCFFSGIERGSRPDPPPSSRPR